MTDNKTKKEHGRGQVNQNKAADLKSTIYYHRAYRKVSYPGKRIFLKFVIFTSPLIIAVLFLSPGLTLIMSNFVKYVILASFSSESIDILTQQYLLGDVYVLDFSTKYPTPLFSFSLFVFSFLTIVLIHKFRIPKPIALWIIFLSFMNLVSSVFFTFFPTAFPYDTKQFSELYIITEINMWLFIPIITGISLLPLPSSTLSKFIIAFSVLIYSIVFGVVRYVVFMYILRKFSIVFMSTLFFSFGPLMDFFYVVSIFSLYVSIISKKTKRDIKAWNWSY